MKRIAFVFLLALAGCAHRAGNSDTGSTPSTPPADESDLGDLMHQYLWRITDARDLVIAGELVSARTGLAEIAAQSPPEGLPEEWQPYVDRVRQHATAGAEPDSDVGAAVANAALACGSCHAQTSGGPGVAFAEAPDLGDSLAAEMHRHVWASDRLWEGIIAPSSERWIAGAAAVYDDADLSNLDTESRSGLSWVDGLDRETVADADADTRASFYAGFISACASCHTQLGVGPGAAP